MEKKQKIIKLLVQKPTTFARMIGFDKLTTLHDGWIRTMICKREDKTIQAHRNSYKTTCVSVAISLIMILLPQKRIAFIRKTNTDITEIIQQVRNILLKDETKYIVRLIWDVDFQLTKETSTQLNTNLNDDVKGTTQLTGFGIGASVTGKHYDIIFTDDIVNVNDRVSRAERERTKLFYQELQNIKNRGGWINNTGTPWHKEDAFELMPEAEKYDCYMTGIMSEEDIESKKKSMSPSLFAANYELRHIAAEDVIFDNPNVGGDTAMIMNSNYSHIDAAYGGEDFTTYTIARKVGGKYYVLGKMWHTHVDNCLPEIYALYNKYLVGKIYCEDNGDKGYLAKEMRKNGYRTVTYREDMNKYIKIVTYLKFEWENVIFVDGTDKEYIDQILDYNENAEHDDAPDSLACIIRKLYSKTDEDERKSAFGF